MPLQGSDRLDFSANCSPITPETWAIVAELSRTVEGTGDVPVRFSRPIEILGFKATVIAKRPLVGGGLILPTVDDIDCMLTTDNEDVWTKRLMESGGEGNFVPLGHMTVDAQRLTRIVPRGDAPDLAFQFQWAQFISAAAPIYEDAIIRLSLLARYITKDERDAWLRGERGSV